MSKQIIADAIKQSYEDMPAAAANKAASAVLEAISTSIRAGGKVAIPGFGTFEVRKTTARQGRNPSTGAVIEIAAKNKVTFKPAKALNESLAAA